MKRRLFCQLECSISGVRITVQFKFTGLSDKKQRGAALYRKCYFAVRDIAVHHGTPLVAGIVIFHLEQLLYLSRSSVHF